MTTIFLIDLYENRPDGRSLADLYPQIITWFEANNQVCMKGYYARLFD
jgi:hypothetical protein